MTRAAAETWSLFQLIARTCDVYGPELLGPIVISMTNAAPDVLTVLLLARWAGCGYVPQIAPLFETIQALKDASYILAELFALEAYQRHLRTHNNQQMVMIGYSDSNKDGGYLMANWALYQAQEEISRVAREHHITLTIFHGRGGTIARGGGPANPRSARSRQGVSMDVSALPNRARLLHRVIQTPCWRIVISNRSSTRFYWLPHPLPKPMSNYVGAPPWIACLRKRNTSIEP